MTLQEKANGLACVSQLQNPVLFIFSHLYLRSTWSMQDGLKKMGKSLCTSLHVSGVQSSILSCNLQLLS